MALTTSTTDAPHQRT